MVPTRVDIYCNHALFSCPYFLFASIASSIRIRKAVKKNFMKYWMAAGLYLEISCNEKNSKPKLIGARYFSKGNDAFVVLGGPGINETVEYCCSRDNDWHGTTPHPPPSTDTCSRDVFEWLELEPLHFLLFMDWVQAYLYDGY